MVRSSTFWCAVTCVCLTVAARPQPKSGDQGLNLKLEVQSSVITQLKGSIFGRVKCDDDGNLYLRPYSSERNESHTLFQAPIQQIRPDGAMGHSFSNTDAMPKLWGRDFFVTPEGEVFQVAFTEKLDNYVLSFSKDGAFRSKIKIETEFFTPYQMAIFKSGQILLSGIKGEGEHTPFTAVFDASGKMVKAVTDQDDLDLGKRAASGDSALVSENSGFGNTAVQFGEAVSGSDGNVYLMRSGSPALVLVVSPQGQIVRKFKVDSGDPQLVSVSMKSAPGRLAFAFRRKDAAGATIEVTDLEGTPQQTYVSEDRRTPGAFFSCFVPPGFLFTQANSQGFVQVHRAKAK